MFHLFGVATNTKGDSLADWQVEVVDLADGETVIPIYSDESQTPISTVSGVTDRAVTDAQGNYDLFVANGTYSLRFYDDAGEFQRLQRYLPMYGAPDPIDFVTETGTTYTLVLTDAYSSVTLNNASAIALTVPTNANVAFAVGTFVEIIQLGAGTVSIAGDTGVTINSRGSRTTTSGQYAVAGLRKVDTNTWVLTGDLV